MHVYIGLDLGTSSLKALAINAEGEVVGVAGAAYATSSPQPGWAEQQPQEWIIAARQALTALAAQLPPGATPAALAVAAQLPTLTLLSPDGESLRPAIVWYDGRAAAEAAQLLRQLDLAEWYQRSGVVFDAHYLAAMHAWVRRWQPDCLPQQGYLVGGAKDALVQALSGAWVTDPSTASGSAVFDPRSGEYDETLLRLSGLSREQLPAIAAPESIAGGLLASWSETGLPVGLPVVVGAGDSLCGVLGAGAAEPGLMAAISGTSTAMLVSTSQPLLDPARRFFLTPHALSQLWALEMDLLSTGSALRWLATQLALAGPAEVEALAMSAPAGAHGLLALPYLAGGEQGALWDETAVGAFVGLSLAADRAALARALLEGIACEMRRALLAWNKAGVEVRRVVLAGSAATPFFSTLLAAVLDRPVSVTQESATTAYGAALLAGIGVGAWSPAQAAALAQRRIEPAIEPDPALATFYAAHWPRYDTLSSSLRALSANLARP